MIESSKQAGYRSNLPFEKSSHSAFCLESDQSLIVPSNPEFLHHKPKRAIRATETLDSEFIE